MKTKNMLTIEENWKEFEERVLYRFDAKMKETMKLAFYNGVRVVLVISDEISKDDNISFNDKVKLIDGMKDEFDLYMSTLKTKH